MRLVFLIFAAAVALALDTPIPPDDSRLVVDNQTGETLTLTIDGGAPIDINGIQVVDVAAGNHHFVMSDPAGDELPRDQHMEAGQSYTWTITHAPDQS
jgi:hypothetical protein